VFVTDPKLHVEQPLQAAASAPPPWMESVAAAVEQRFAAAGIRLTLGGEPTYVPLQPSGAEWSVAADGPTKLPLARAMARELQRRQWPGSTLLYCPGKRYEGEVNPRWALRMFIGVDGEPAVRWPEPADGAAALAPAAGGAWLAELAGRLKLALQPLELVDPLDPERRVWAVPLSAADPDPADPEAAVEWLPAAWPLEPALRQLNAAPGPAGLRLPLEHFPAELPRQVLTLETDGEGWELFLPPLTRLPLTALLQAIADSLDGLARPNLSGMVPVDCDRHWQVLGLTADPGVLEINLPRLRPLVAGPGSGRRRRGPAQLETGCQRPPGGHRWRQPPALGWPQPRSAPLLQPPRLAGGHPALLAAPPGPGLPVQWRLRRARLPGAAAR
jgi:uncharacterized protein (DUF2126 family)